MATPKKIIVPLPHAGFDPSEAAIPWKILTARGATVSFATPSGKVAAADERMVTGRGLGLFKKQLMARKDAVEAYREMTASVPFNQPLRYTDLAEKDFDALLLPGGHAKEVREYLESSVLQNLAIAFFDAGKPVAAVCHGVLIPARSIHPETGKPVIYRRNTTCLLQKQELLAWRLTRWWLKDYYLTYPGLTTQAEVTAALETPEQFKTGPFPFARDRAKNTKPGFVVRDGNYLTARWPGDIYRFSETLCDMLQIP